MDVQPVYSYRAILFTWRGSVTNVAGPGLKREKKSNYHSQITEQMLKLSLKNMENTENI